MANNIDTSQIGVITGIAKAEFDAYLFFILKSYNDNAYAEYMDKRKQIEAEYEASNTTQQ